MHVPVTPAADSRSRGDTMVEVLISIAVVAMVLGGAYVTTNRSLLATRAAQERAIALKLAESQIERLKGLMTVNPGAVTGAAPQFCITEDADEPVAPANDQACQVGPDGAPTEVEPVFHLAIDKPAANNYVLSVRWFNVRGEGQDSLQLRYRVYD